MASFKEQMALGCFLGVAIGDASGVVLEFDWDITPEKVESAMDMPGGGTFSVGNGQISDDSELSICLARGLLSKGSCKTYEDRLNEIAKTYVAWIRTPPFDVGGTCSRAFAINPETPEGSFARHMIHNSGRCNVISKANGSLMRIAPIAIFGHKLKINELATIARVDAKLSHPNQTTQDCNAAYCIAIAHLINHHRDALGALKVVSDWVMDEGCQEVRDWLLESAKDCSDLNCCERNIGFVRWAFTLAFYHLRQKTPFKEAIRETLMRFGDCDTNAAIVGGMMGAYWGTEDMPKDMIEKVLWYDFDTHEGRKRPTWLSAKNIPDLTRKLLEQAPEFIE